MPTVAPPDDSILCQPTGEKKKKEVGETANKKSDPPKRKQYRKKCSADGCKNQAYIGGVCKRHRLNKPTGNEKKRKEVDDAAANDNENGPPKKKQWRKECKAEGCTKRAQNGGVCVEHGARVKRCSAEGCTNQAINGGVCQRHGAKFKICSVDVCTNQAQRGGVCVRHGATHKRCTVDGCNKQAQRGGLCQRHGSLGDRCRFQGCENKAVRGGVCKRHGSYLVLVQLRQQQEKLPTIGSRKQKDVIEQSNTAAFRTAGEANNAGQKIAENKGNNREKNKPDKLAVGGVNSRKDDKERDASDQVRSKKISGLSEIAAAAAATAAATAAAGGGVSGGGGGYNENEANDDNDGAEVESRVHIVEGVTANVEKESTQMAAAEPDSRMVAKTANDYSAEITSLKARLETSTQNEASLKREKLQLHARMKASAVELKEMTNRVYALNALLAQVTRKEAVLNARLQEVTDDFAIERSRLQSKVKELTAKLEEKPPETKQQ